MDEKRIVVVGGVAGGMSFATRYKRLHPFHEVLVIDKGPYVSFANCGLPYALGDVITKRHRLIVETKERLGARFENRNRGHCDFPGKEGSRNYARRSKKSDCL